jgi:hypothetical protein
VKSIVVSVFILAVVVGVLFKPLSFAFPAMVAYVAYGLGKTFFFGLVDRLPTDDPLLDEGFEEDYVSRSIEMAERPGSDRRRRRRNRGRNAGGSGSQSSKRPEQKDGA